MNISISQKTSVSYKSIDISYEDDFFILDFEENEKDFILEDIVLIQKIGKKFLNIEDISLCKKAIDYLENNSISFKKNEYIKFDSVIVFTINGEKEIYFKSEEKAYSFYSSIVELMYEKIQNVHSFNSHIFQYSNYDCIGVYNSCFTLNFSNILDVNYYVSENINDAFYINKELYKNVSFEQTFEIVFKTKYDSAIISGCIEEEMLIVFEKMKTKLEV